jgi:23S rRNA (adenine2503-C2)-methyltransferase
VFMGMGEPMDNFDEVLKVLKVMTEKWGFAWSPKRITVSSIGKLDTLRRLLDETSVHVAISVHSPYHEERLSLMPVEKPYPVRDVMKCLRQYDFAHQRRLSVEYIMWSGLNDDDTHAQALVDLLAGSNSRVNLIRFHAIPGVNLKTTDEQRMVAFRDYLNKKGVIATIRRSRGEDIFAACGMLAGKVKKK